MTDFNAEMRSLVCRDQLWYLSALIDDLKTRHPGYVYRDKLEEAYKALSLAIDIMTSGTSTNGKSLLLRPGSC